MNKKKVLFVAADDWANSGYKYCEALNRHSNKYEVEYFAGNAHPFGYARGENILWGFDDKGVQYTNYDIVRKLQDSYAACDIVMFKDDQAVYKEMAGIKFDRDIPVVALVSGFRWRSYYTAIHESIKGRYTKLLATTPDLLFFDDMSLLPFPIDMEKYKFQPKSDDCIIIGHNSSSKEKKGTDNIVAALDRLCMENPNKVYGNVSIRIPFNYNMELKRINHIYVDQVFGFGIYGNAAVEAMAYGQIVVADVNNPKTPIQYATKETLYNVLSDLIKTIEEGNHDLYDTTYSYCLTHHSYPVISATLDKVFDSVLK